MGTLHVLLVIGANIYVLTALLLGNLAGVFWSYRQQQADAHDSAADLCACLKLAREHPDDQKWIDLRRDLLVFLQVRSTGPSTPSNSTEVMPLQLDYDPTVSSVTRIRRGRQGAGAFAPYSDVPPAPFHANLQL